MLKGKRKLIVLPVLLLVLGAAGYSFAKPTPAAKKKIEGTVYVLPKSFLLNLSGGHYAKLNVALLLAPGQSTGATAGAGASASSGEEGAGTLPQEPVIRAIVTNVVTGKSSEALIHESGRTTIRQDILHAIEKETEVKVESVLFTGLTVQ